MQLRENTSIRTEFLTTAPFMIDMIKRYRDEFPCRQPVLNHGDYLPGHIFVDEALRITGVIDFGMYEGSPPAH